MSAELKKFTESVYEGLKKDFPVDAYAVDSSRGFNLTSLKAQYAVERLNDVCGVNGWKLKGEYTETTKGILYLGTLSLMFGGEEIHSVEAIGYSDNKKNVGDTYKSARTDALSKASSYLGLGNEMFKGNVAPPVKGKGGGYTKPSYNKKTTTTTPEKKSSGGFNKPKTETKTTKVDNGGWQ